MNTLRRISRHMVKAVAAGAVLVAAALPAAMASTTAGAATSNPTLTCVTTYAYYSSGVCYAAEADQGAFSTKIFVVGTGFATDNGPVTMTTTAPGVTISGVHEWSGTHAIAYVRVPASTTPGFYDITLTDDNGTVTLAKGLGIGNGPVLNSVSPASLADNINQVVTLTGSNLNPDGSLFAYDKYGSDQGCISNVNVTSDRTTVTFNWGFDCSDFGPWQADNISFVWQNPEPSQDNQNTAGALSNAVTMAITGPTITGVNTSLPSTGVTSLTISGTGFQAGATVTLDPPSGDACISLGTPSVTATAITVVATTSGCSNFTADVRVTNPDGTTADTTNNILGVGSNASLVVVAPQPNFDVLGSLNDGSTTDLYVVGYGNNWTNSSTVTFSNALSGKSFTGTLTTNFALGGFQEAVVTTTPPRFNVTTATQAITAGATTIFVANVGGYFPGEHIMISDGLTSQADVVLAATANAGSTGLGSLTLALPVAAAHASGVAIEGAFTPPYVSPYKYLGLTGYQMVITTGATTAASSSEVNVEGPLTQLKANAEVDLDSGSLVGGYFGAGYLIDSHNNPFYNVGGSVAVDPNHTAVDIAFGTTATYYGELPGFGFGAGSSVAYVDSTTLKPAPGWSGTLSATSTGTATLTVTAPSSITAPMNQDGGFVIGDHEVCLQNTDPTDPVSALAAGSTVTATNTTTGDTQTFNVLSSSNTGPNCADSTWYDVTFSAASTFTFPQADTVWTSPDVVLSAGANDVQSVDAVIFGANGAIDVIPNAFQLGTYNSPITITGVAQNQNCTDPGSYSVGQGASGVDFSVSGTGFAWPNTKTTLTSSNPDVTITVDGNNSTCIYGTLSVKAGAALSNNVPLTVTVNNGFLGSKTSTSGYLSIVAGPTITSVTNLGSLTPDSSNNVGGLVTVNGTGLSGADLYAIPSTGWQAGAADVGSVYVGSGAIFAPSCTVTTSTQRQCYFSARYGSTSGTDTVLADAGWGGSAISSTPFVTINGPTVSASPSELVYGTYTAITLTTTNMGYTQLDYPGTYYSNACRITVLTPALGYVADYYCRGGQFISANVLTVNVNNDWHWTYPAGDVVVVSLQSNTTGDWQDSNPIPIVSAAHVYGSSGTVSVGGTSHVTVWGFNFQPNTTLTYECSDPTLTGRSGVTVVTNSVSPNTLTATVTTTATHVNTECYFFVNGDYSNWNVSFDWTYPPYLDGGYSWYNLDGSPLTTSEMVPGGKYLVYAYGDNFQAGATVVSTNSLFTIGTPVFSNNNGAGYQTIAVPVTVGAFTGVTGIYGGLTVTNPDGRSTTISGTRGNYLFYADPAPTVTGGPYYVPTFATNQQLIVTGTMFDAGTLTATITSATAGAYSLVSTPLSATCDDITHLCSATLTYSTTAAAIAGTSATVTLTNGDGLSVSFQLNGGPAPVPATPLSISRIQGRPAKIGGTTVFIITGKNFGPGTKVKSSDKLTKIRILSTSSGSVTFTVSVKKTAKRGVRHITVSNANGSKSVSYSQK